MGDPSDGTYVWERRVDEEGTEQAILYDTSNPDRWLSVEVVNEMVPDFSAPETWVALRKRLEKRARDAGKSRYQLR